MSNSNNCSHYHMLFLLGNLRKGQREAWSGWSAKFGSKIWCLWVYEKAFRTWMSPFSIYTSNNHITKIIFLFFKKKKIKKGCWRTVRETEALIRPLNVAPLFSVRTNITHLSFNLILYSWQGLFSIRLSGWYRHCPYD